MFRSQSLRQGKPELRHSKSETSLVNYTRERRRSSTCSAVKIVVLGASGVGKTALTVRFLTRRFIGEYHPTLETTHRYRTTVDDDEVAMEILDTAGDVGNVYRDGQTSWAEAFMLVYSIADRTSFEQIEQMWKDIRANRQSGFVAAILVGNKNDLKHYREVTQNDGDRLADAIGCPFYEVSAMDGQQIPLVTELFRNAVRELRMKRLEGRKLSSASQMKRAVRDFLSFRASKTRLNSASS